MSCDWNIHCVDCNDTHQFSDANHRDRLMWLLINHAGAIANLEPLFADDQADELNFDLRRYGGIDPSWFVEHLGHKLRPIDEYGRIQETEPEL